MEDFISVGLCSTAGREIQKLLVNHLDRISLIAQRFGIMLINALWKCFNKILWSSLLSYENTCAVKVANMIWKRFYILGILYFEKKINLIIRFCVPQVPPWPRVLRFSDVVPAGRSFSILLHPSQPLPRQCHFHYLLCTSSEILGKGLQVSRYNIRKRGKQEDCLLIYHDISKVNVWCVYWLKSFHLL